MNTRHVLVGAVLAAFSLPAFASHCPTDVKAIDDALAAGPQISEEQMQEVKMLRDEGASLHEAGNHADSETALHKAMEILGLEHPS